MSRPSRLSCLVALLVLASCERPKPTWDGGEEDAGTDAGTDAGRVRGDEPPTGYSLALPIPANAPAATRFGVSAAAALDQFSHPMVAGITVDPNGDSTLTDNALVFTRWSGVDGGTWEPPLTVEVVGAIDLSHPNRQVSLARDPDTGRLGLAYVASSGALRLGTSDDEGAHWTLENATAPGGTVSNPALGMKGGTLHLAWYDGAARSAAGGVKYAKRVGSGTWSEELAPLAAGFDGDAAGPLALALDSTGKPGVALVQTTTSGPTVAIAFWRPGTASAAKVADSQGTANAAGTAQQPSVSLTFEGELPRLAWHLATPTPDAQLWFAKASDAAGTTWATPVAMPRNGLSSNPEGTQWYQAVAVDGAKVAIASNYAQVGPAQLCGGPKLSRSNDGVSFTTCAPDTLRTFGYAGQFPSLFFHRAGKLTLLFNYEVRSNPTVGGGVVMWREP